MEITKVVKPFIRRGWPNTFGNIVYMQNWRATCKRSPLLYFSVKITEILLEFFSVEELPGLPVVGGTNTQTTISLAGAHLLSIPVLISANHFERTKTTWLHLHLCRRFYPKWLTAHSTVQCILCYTFCQYVCFLGIEPTTFALLTQCSTTEPQEHFWTWLIFMNPAAH